MKKLEAKVVNSLAWNGSGLLSLRDRSGNAGSALGLKQGLVNAGFVEGEEVVIIEQGEYSRLLERDARLRGLDK